MNNRMKELELLQLESDRIPETLNIDHIKYRIKARNRKRRVVNGIRKTMLSAAAILVVFAVLVNTSTSFANAIGDIPFLNKVAEIVTFNDGYKNAVEHEYAQYIGQVQGAGDNELELVYVLADENRIVSFFRFNQVEDKYADKYLSFREVKIGESLNRKNIEASIMSSSFTVSKGEPFIGFECVLSSDATKREYVKEYDIEVEVVSCTEPEEIIGKYQYHLSLNDPVKPMTYLLNNEIVIEGQTITVEKVEIYPTTAKITVKEDENNTMIFKDILFMLRNENNEVWGVVGGLTRSGNDYFIESNYFTNYKKLYLEIGEVEFMDKKKQLLPVDCHKGTFTDGSKLLSDMELQSVSKQLDGTYKIEMSYIGSYKKNTEVIFGYQQEKNQEPRYDYNHKMAVSNENRYYTISGIQPNEEGIVYLIRNIPTATVQADYSEELK